MLCGENKRKTNTRTSFLRLVLTSGEHLGDEENKKGDEKQSENKDL